MPEFLRQLWKRRAFQFAALYLGAAWVMLQVAVVLEQTLELPTWIDQSVLVLLIIGFPLVLILAWAQGSRSGETPKQSKSQASPTNLSTEEPSIVVLPFRYREHDEVEQITAEGLTDDITSLLTLVKVVRVVPRQAIARVLKPNDDALQIARDLGGRYALTGSVRRNGNQLRVSAELTDINDKHQKWSQKFDRPADDIFTIQDEIAKGVVSALGGVIVRVEGARALRQPPENLMAWELTRRALSVTWDWRPETLNQGMLDARKAIALDPNYALAHSALAMILSWRSVSGWTEAVSAERNEAVREADKAAKIGYDNAEALWPIINSYWATNPQRSVELYERSIERQPDIFLASPFAMAHAGVAYAKVGREEEGIALIKQFQDTFPNHEYGVWTRTFLGYCELCRRNYPLVADLLANTNSEHDGMCRVIALMNSNQQDEAVTEFNRWKAANSKIKLDHYIEYFKGYHADDAIGDELSDGLKQLKAIL
ncbi:MAG: hypothetical protein COA47_02200 [Robiginitomaculum sp.]|nr:MAG: hypothetical protein COA47_02200 [Robiginitomaculum sp.]